MLSRYIATCTDKTDLIVWNLKGEVATGDLALLTGCSPGAGQD